MQVSQQGTQKLKSKDSEPQVNQHPESRACAVSFSRYDGPVSHTLLFESAVFWQSYSKISIYLIHSLPWLFLCFIAT